MSMTTITDKYEVTIGLEIHVQLATKSKMFCRCNNDSENAEPNVNVCPICMGYPGTLPVTNKQALEFGIRLASALGCEINKFQRFDRKNYFYPDLPKGYQISQFFYPVGEHGRVTVDYLGEDRKTKQGFEVGITRLHLEEDAGKLTHGATETLVDLNRCGTPLAEIVTGPDIYSPEQARAFMYELQRIVRSLGVSMADMEKGHLRVDGNISIRPFGQTELGGKVEIKNLNSFKFLEQALNYEVDRQAEILDRGEVVVQETRGWDEKTGTTVSQRVKEGSVDYRYFPDPDLPPIVYSLEEIGKLVADNDRLPQKMREKAESLGLAYDRVIELQDKNLLSKYLELTSGWEDVESTTDNSRVIKLANMLTRGMDFESREQVTKFFELVEANKLTSTATMRLYDLSIACGVDPATVVDEVKGLGTEGVEVVVQQVLADNPQEAERYRLGESKLAGFFIGQVMAKLGGGAEPALVKEIIDRLLTK